jgi:putative pyruvate formate lyase activating enzyme
VTFTAYQNCRLCPRNCGVNRLAGHTGFCGETAELRIASIDAHFGEEPPITGSNGSGTIFFSGCSLGCVFCQNYQISCFHLGAVMTVEAVAGRIVDLYQSHHIHNVNFVTSDHYSPHTLAIVQELRKKNVRLPVLYNGSGYAKIETLLEMEDFADIYMPDYKYADIDLAHAFSRCRDYPGVALDAIAEMVRQKGFLDSFIGDRTAATRGVFVRHLVLPSHVQNSIDALSILFSEFGRELPISLMSQYWPARPMDVPELNRRISAAEFYQVYDHAMELGFNNLFVQHIQGAEEESDFLPDFKKERPFKGNVKQF